MEIEEYAEGKFKGTYIAKESGKFIDRIINFSADEYIAILTLSCTIALLFNLVI